jgi:hypothetical protein
LRRLFFILFPTLIFTVGFSLNAMAAEAPTAQSQDLPPLPPALLIESEADLTPPAVDLSPEDQAADLDFLQTNAEKAYAGPALKHTLAPLHADPRAMDALTFCRRLQERLATVADGHLRARLLNQGCGGRSGLGEVGANLAAGERAWRLAYPGRGDLPVVAVPVFLNHADPSWDGFLATVRALKEAGRPFALDLRGNAGGDDSMAYEMARVLYGLDPQEPVPTPVMAWRRLETPEAFAVLANGWALDILRLRQKGEEIPDYEEQGRRQALVWMERARSGRFPAHVREEIAQPKRRARPVFSAPLYILVDRRCASACENTLQFLEALPHRVLVGEHSSGTVMYGNVGRLILPRSRVIVSLATFAVEYRDRREVEKRGYAPDRAIPPGQDALQFLLDLTRGG